MSLQKCGLSLTKVALMQLNGGNREAAFNTLNSNGWSARKANDFLDRARLSGVGAAEYQSTEQEEIQDGDGGADDDRMVDEDGYTEVTPEFDEFDMLTTLEDPPDSEPQAELAPQEAYEAMKFMAPLDEEETALLHETPFLQEDPHGHGAPLSWVDDPDHTEFLINRMNARQKGMDEVLEDEMYGEPMSLTEEEIMDRAGCEVGFGLSSLRKVGRSIGRTAKKVGRTAVRTAVRSTKLATMPISKLASVAKRFVPGRDAGKAKMVKDLNTKLVKEHANYLATLDRKRGVKKPVGAYIATSRSWAKNKIQQAGLPTSFTSGSVVAGDILGTDACGSWWNPMSWFSSKTKYVLLNTEGERVAELSEEEYQAATAAAAAQPGTDAQPADMPPDETMPEEAPPEEPPPDYSEGEDWSSSLMTAFRGGQQAGRLLNNDDSEGENMRTRHRHQRNQRVAGINAVSDGAYEERMIEASGDADIRRKFHRGRRRHHGRRLRSERGHGMRHQSSPEGQRLKELIKQQLPSGVVSQALVQKWATERAGASSGPRYDGLYARMNQCITKRGATLSADKSETAGAFVGDFVGWA